jgi:hypothetical protein
LHLCTLDLVTIIAIMIDVMHDVAKMCGRLKVMGGLVGALVVDSGPTWENIPASIQTAVSHIMVFTR